MYFQTVHIFYIAAAVSQTAQQRRRQRQQGIFPEKKQLEKICRVPLLLHISKVKTRNQGAE